MGTHPKHFCLHLASSADSLEGLSAVTKTKNEEAVLELACYWKEMMSLSLFHLPNCHVVSTAQLAEVDDFKLGTSIHLHDSTQMMEY